MTEESKIRDVVDAVTGVAKAIPVYDDVVQPAAKEIGKGLQTIAKTVHVALAPVSALVWGYDQIKDFVSTKVADRLKNVKAEDIVTPKPNLAGPVLESLRYTGHEEALSDLYANLLAASMDKSTASTAHPAFAEIIKQLTPDEAKLIGLFIYQMPFPLLKLRAELQEDGRETGSGYDVLVNFSLLGQQAGCEHVDLVPTYLDNLCRLGLAEIPVFFEYTAPGIYDPLEQSEVVQAAKRRIASVSNQTAKIQRKGLVVTQLGRQFARVCVMKKA
jgi:hypothetical protein